MAKGDVVPTVYRGSGGRTYSGGSSYVYDDEGRGDSKRVWEWFEEHFTANPTLEWLTSLDDGRCYWLLKNSVIRYNLQDIAFNWSPGYDEGTDARAHRLVVRMLNEDDWLTFHKHLVAGYDRQKEENDKAYRERQEEWREQARQASIVQAQREAEQLRVEHEEYNKALPDIQFTAGMLSSELNQVFISNDVVGDYGDWFEDAVDVYISGEGWGREDNKATGIKLQITLSLDLSNSMYYNGVHKECARTFRDLGLTLKAMQASYPEDLYIGFFQFSLDNAEGRGKRAYNLAWDGVHGRSVWRDDTPRRELEDKYEQFYPLRETSIEKWWKNGIFDGTDTWFYPLFQEIETWEKANSDPGCVRLDIILTDAVIEHTTDVRKSDIIQERRNGELQTVLLNFLPEDQWVNSTLPKRCYQMAVNVDTVAGILRNVVSEFVGVHI